MKQRNQPPRSDRPGELAGRITHNRNDFWARTMDPIFRFDSIGATADQVLISPYRTNGRDETIILPFRIVNTDIEIVSFIQSILTPWTIDLSTTGINLLTQVGGAVDGITIAASEDYLVWGFYNPSLGTGGFEGLGFTRRPHETTTALSGGTVGSSTTFTVAAGRGFTFPVGCRIIAREGTALGSDYNQGIVTAHTSTTVVATLDAAYGLGAENNATIANPVELLQIDKFQPRITASDSLYPGGGVEYAYCYLGHIQSDASSNVRMFRKRGELYRFPTVDGYNLSNFTASTGASQQASCRRILPSHCLVMQGAIFAQNPALAGQAQAAAGTDSITTIGNGQLRQRTDSLGTASYDSGPLTLRSRDTSLYHIVARTVTATTTSSVMTMGYWETEF